MTEDSKLKLGKSQMSRLSKKGAKDYLIGKNNSSCRKDVREKMSSTRLERKLSVGENNPMFGKTHTAEAVKKIMSHRPMNKFEETVAKLLTENGYKYTFQFFITKDDRCKSYDFKIKGKPIIIEADGDFWHGNPDTKYHWKDSDAVIENDILKESMAKERGYNIIRVWESEFKKTPSILLEKLQNPIFI
jgi:G:T-mismatch repair DNA endonuclease (very short patch repair protein)